MKPTITIIGAGLAGAEAAWQAQKCGVHVRLVEMKPKKYTPAHHAEGFAELVCSNSLRSDSTANAVGLLKAEMRAIGSLVMEAADATRVPAGSALAVDREKFSAYITEKLRACENVEIVEAEAESISESDGITVVATGPLTSDTMANFLQNDLGLGGLHFFDAAAPIVDAQSINMDTAFFASRYDKGDADYINCPMNAEQYEAFWQALISAEEAPLHDFDREEQKNLKVFEGCMPVEVMARRGRDTLLFGPLKPVGLVDPRVGKASHAVVQLRKENVEGTMYNLVGFQTHLTFPEQRRVFRMIPGLENAEFLRYGVMHRNTYLNSPEHLGENYRLKNKPIWFAGQMTGVEGYVESAGSGLLAGLDAARAALGKESVVFPRTTMLGAMSYYVANGGVGAFTPMNANFGIVEPLPYRVKGGKAAKNEELSRRALSEIDLILEKLE